MSLFPRRSPTLRPWIDGGAGRTTSYVEGLWSRSLSGGASIVVWRFFRLGIWSLSRLFRSSTQKGRPLGRPRLEPRVRLRLAEEPPGEGPVIAQPEGPRRCGLVLGCGVQEVSHLRELVVTHA